MKERVEATLNKIRPMLQRDGGDLELVEIKEDNTVIVKLKGHCVGCPHAMMTLKGVVEQVLKREVPEIKEVEALDFTV